MFMIMELEYCTLNPTDYYTIIRNSFDLDNTKMIKYRIASLFYNNVHNFTIKDLKHSKVNETDYYYLHISYLYKNVLMLSNNMKSAHNLLIKDCRSLSITFSKMLNWIFFTPTSCVRYTIYFLNSTYLWFTIK